MIWLDPEQLNKLGVSRRQLTDGRTGTKYQKPWTWRETSRRGRNGKPIREYLLESMSVDWQRKWLAMQPTLDSSLTTELDNSLDAWEADGDNLGEQGKWETSGAEDRLAQALKRYDMNVRDAFLAEAQRLASIVERFNAIKPKQVRDSKGKMTIVPAVLDLCTETRCSDPAILAVEPARAKSRSFRTLYIWSTDFEKDGLAAFLRKPAEPTGKPDRRRVVVSEDAVAWIEANWRKKPSPEKLHQALKKEAAKFGWKIPSRGTIWRLYDGMGEVRRTLIFEGQKAYTSKFAPYVPRDYRDLAALQVLCGDHSVRDVTVMLPDGSLKRPWLTLWQDLRTGLIWGWHLDLTPSSITIGLAYANGVQNFGAQPVSRPEAEFYSYLYTDQGRDYKCKQLSGQLMEFENKSFGKAGKIDGGLNSLCTQLRVDQLGDEDLIQRRVGFMDDLGLQHKMARGYNAREKFIERTHKDISEWEKNTFENEYCGRGIGHKPERWQASWHRHQKLLKKAGKNLDWILSESPFMTLDDYRDNLAGWINEYNHSEHKRSVLGGSTIVPITEYERLYTTRYEIKAETLALLLMRAGKRKIGKNGVQMLQPHWHFICEEMLEFRGHEIEVRYSDDDYNRVWAVLPDGRVVEAERLETTTLLNPNKRTLARANQLRAKDAKDAREFHLMQQNRWNGVTIEDRVNEEFADPNEAKPPEAEKLAVNARPTVHMLNRWDRIHKAPTPLDVTGEDVRNANVIEMFATDRPTKKRIKEEWED